jgi:hypothetical protein
VGRRSVIERRRSRCTGKCCAGVLLSGGATICVGGQADAVAEGRGLSRDQAVACVGSVFGILPKPRGPEWDTCGAGAVPGAREDHVGARCRSDGIRKVPRGGLRTSPPRVVAATNSSLCACGSLSP